MSATLPTLPDMTGATAGFAHGLSAIPADGVGWSITVNPGDNLQAALQQGVNNGGSGTIFLGGGTWAAPTDGFVLPARPNDGSWITIRPIPALEANLPPAGVRIAPPAHAAFMPKISASNYGNSGIGALTAYDDTHGWRIIGLEFFVGTTYADTGGTAFVYRLVGLGIGKAPGSWFHLSSPNDGTRYIFERCYIHGKPNNANFAYFQCGLKLGGWDIRVRDCYITDVSSDQSDSQAIGITDAQGLHWIENNYLAATGQSIMYGGAGTTGDSGVAPNAYGDRYLPKDITVVRNTFTKLPKWNPNAAAWGLGTWDGQPWRYTKGGFELKIGQRVLCEGNTFFHLFYHAFQGAYVAVALDAFNQNGGSYTNAGLVESTQARVEDITVRYNTFDLVTGMLQMWSGNRPVRRVHFHDNLALRVRHDVGYNPGSDPNAAWAQTFHLWGTAAHLLTVSTGEAVDAFDDVCIEHNTALPNTRIATGLDHIIAPESSTYRRLTIRNNIFGYGYIGVFANTSAGDHGDDDPNRINGAAFAAHCLDRDWQQNALINAESTNAGQQATDNVGGRYPRPRWIAADLPGATPHGVNLSTGELAPTSPFKATGTYPATDAATRQAAGLSGDLGVDFAAMTAALNGGPPPAPSAPVITGTPRAGDVLVTGTGQAGATVQLFRDGVAV